MTPEQKQALAWLVAQPDTEWFDTADVAAGSGVAHARAFEVLDALEKSGDVACYYGGSGPCMFYATAKARREAREPIAP